MPVSSPLSSRACSPHPAATATTATRSARHWRCASREMSPTRFSNSVHNAAAGYWSIATGAKRESNVLCAFDASFCAGLLEALAQVVVEGEPVLLVAYDTEYPEPLHAKRPVPDAFGAALVLTPHRERGSLARIEASLARTTCRRVDRSAARSAARVHPRRALPAVAAAAGDAAPGAARFSITWTSRARPCGSIHAVESRLDRGAHPAQRPHVPARRSHLLGSRNGSAAAAADTVLPDHPLRAHGRLGIACGIEFAAQAMAVHGALTARRVRRRRRAPDFWRAFATCGCTLLRLDDVQTDLICNAVRIAGDARTALYEFELRSAKMSLMSGRATVVLDADYRQDR